MGEKEASLGTRHTLEEGPLRKKIRGVRAQKKDGGVVQRANPLSPCSTSWSHSVNGGNQSRDQDSTRCTSAEAQPHAE